MEVKNTNITIDTQSLTPTFTIRVDLEFGYKVEAPISISGRLLSNDGKVIAFLNEHQVNSDNSYGIAILTREQKDKLYREKNVNSYYAQLTASLTHKAIEHIEIQREKDHEKAVRFNLEFVVKYIDIPAEPPNLAADNLLRLQVKRPYSNIVIKQSDWVKNFSPQLGIGNFLLLELQIPDDKKVTAFWKELYEKLTHNLKDIEICLRSGDWQKTMFFARKFYENAKIGDNKKAHAKFKDEFSKLMTKDQHSQQGIDDLHTAIWKLFEFTSKYVHDKDKEGNLNPLPVSTKEDAYFAYAIALGLLNLIGRKTNAD
jgi:hypothetical protein